MFAGLAVQIREDLHFSSSAQGLVSFGYFAVSALASSTSGRIAERVGSRRAMRAAGGFGAASLLLIALAPTYALIICALTVGGLANALAQPAANALVVRAVHPSRNGFALGVKQAAIPTATLLAGLAVPTIGLTVGWRWAFAGAAALALGSTVVVPPIDDRPTAIKAAGARRTDSARRPLVVLAVAVGLGSAVANALGAFTTSSAVHSGIPESAAGWLLAGCSAVGLVLRVFSGWKADRRSGGHFEVVAFMLGLGAVGLALLSVTNGFVTVVASMLAFGAGWSWPGVFNLAVVSYNPTAPALATGITQTGSYTGGALGPLLFGVIVQHASYGVAWWTFAGVALAAVAVMMVGRRLIDPDHSGAGRGIRVAGRPSSRRPGAPPSPG